MNVLELVLLTTVIWTNAEALNLNAIIYHRYPLLSKHHVLCCCSLVCLKGWNEQRSIEVRSHSGARHTLTTIDKALTTLWRQRPLLCRHWRTRLFKTTYIMWHQFSTLYVTSELRTRYPIHDTYTRLLMLQLLNCFLKLAAYHFFYSDSVFES